MTHDADSGTVREFLSRHLSRFYIYIYTYIYRERKRLLLSRSPLRRRSPFLRDTFSSYGARIESARSSFDPVRRYPGSWNVLGSVEKIGRGEKKRSIEVYGVSFDGR